MTDLLIGGIDNYSWRDIAPWILSIKTSGFTGDIILVCYRIAPDVIAQIEAHGVTTYETNKDIFLNTINHTAHGPTQAHNLRFYHIWEVLAQCSSNEYEFVITTDVRDVVFQTNPSEWLAQSIDAHSDYRIIAPSEGIRYKNEEWGMNNFLSSYGPVVWQFTNMAEQVSCNVGTIAGDFDNMRDLCFQLYTMTQGRPYPSDQSGYNILTHALWRDVIKVVDMQEGWAAQIGTTLDPTKSWLWERLEEKPPEIRDGTVYVAGTDRPFALVHQWDRNPTLKQFITSKYHG